MARDYGNSGGTTTKKKFNDVKDTTQSSLPPKNANLRNTGGENKGQFGAVSAPFSQPFNEVSAGIGGIAGLHDDIGEKSGFITDGYLDKGDTPYGEAAKFNFLPPGMDISNQANAEIHEMPLKKVVAESYPGDGWNPAPRDLPE